jgi:hypothetical protein
MTQMREEGPSTIVELAVIVIFSLGCSQDIDAIGPDAGKEAVRWNQ